MKKILMMLTLTVVLVACHSNDDGGKEVQPERTVIIYMAGENNLTIKAWNNLQLMKEGSKTLADNQCLLVYVDRSHPSELPYLARLRGGMLTDSVNLKDMGISTQDEYASDPHVFEDVLRYAVSHHTATKDYGLVLWGHSTGWLMQDSLLYTRGYGFDNGQNNREMSTGYWLNIPTMKRVLEKIPAKWSFIMADCCHFACLETAYELRGIVDYILGSAAEIPSDGAPYNKIVGSLFLPAEQACKTIADKYYTHLEETQPLVVINTREMGALAEATRYALQAAKDSLDRAGRKYPEMKGIIHYQYDGNPTDMEFHQANSVLYDAGDFMRHYTPLTIYGNWRTVLDRAVIHRLIATRWRTSVAWGLYFDDFKVTEESYHGVSMFVAQDPAGGHYASYNQDIKKLGWYYAAGYKDIGW